MDGRPGLEIVALASAALYIWWHARWIATVGILISKTAGMILLAGAMHVWIFVRWGVLPWEE